MTPNSDTNLATYSPLAGPGINRFGIKKYESTHEEESG